jgi:hypothetical protein
MPVSDTRIRELTAEISRLRRQLDAIPQLHGFRMLCGGISPAERDLAKVHDGRRAELIAAINKAHAELTRLKREQQTTTERSSPS